MSKPRLECEPWGHGRWGMRLTCPDHPDFIWSFDGESWEPGEWEQALQIAYGHYMWAHRPPTPRLDEDDPKVCIAHGAFIPCRWTGEHRVTGNPYWVKVVRDYHGSLIDDLTWEPAWESRP